ncbi:L-threonate dehydrogenase [Actibacterium lipolyticum]|uniref:L-threonate dehydrogenase n=1 Tax=Actibacterium lipolyticum TaxID=1524263 RepID=A0A238L8I4_9RHOB|nr:L-threonate dehydrogenase [Actibacterium lipolyticum]SMX51131.1 2-(hydroxymethyl)glutarate dehydrogenase [Actibacterium lipolyticum]
MANTTVAIFGLGAMGFGMAGALVRAGLTTHGYDVNPDAVARFRAAGGAEGEFDDVAATLDAVVVVVVNAAQTESVLFGENGIASRLSPGTAVVICATVAPEFAREMARRCEELGLHYLDAPVSGGTIRAGDGSLSILAAGSPAAFEKAGPALEAMSEKVFDMGDQVGAGSSMKAVNQMLVGIQIAAMAEAITFGISQGVEPAKFLEVIRQCAGTSWALESRAPHVIAGDYTPLSAVDIWPKDLGIVLDIAKDAKFSAPITAAALQQYLAASGSGLGKEDDAAVAKVYARNAGLTLPGEG